MLRTFTIRMKRPSTVNLPSSSAAGESSTPKPPSENSSDNPVDAIRAQQLLVTFRIGVGSEIVRLYINAAQRTDTYLDGQGDHVTSYTLILQALLTGASTHLRRAISLIQAFAKKMLPAGNLEAFNKITEPKPHTHTQRKDFMRFLAEQQTTLTAAGFSSADTEHRRR